MKVLTFLILFSIFFISCGTKKEEVNLEEKIVETTFGANYYREASSTQNWRQVEGSFKVRFNLNTSFSEEELEFETIEMDLSSFSDFSRFSCSGRVDYLVNEDINLEEQREDNYDIFSDYTPPSEFFPEETQEDDDTEETNELESFERELKVQLSRENVNTDCPITFFEENSIFIKLFENGDLLYRDTRRGYEFFMRPL